MRGSGRKGDNKRSFADIIAEEEIEDIVDARGTGEMYARQVVPTDRQILSIYEFDSEASENQRIFDLFSRLVGSMAVMQLPVETLARRCTMPSTGRPLTTARFRDVFGDYDTPGTWLHDAASIAKGDVVARLFETAHSGEKGDAVRAQTFIAERLVPQFSKKTEHKVEIDIEAKIEVQKKVEETRTHAFALLEQLADAKRGIQVTRTEQAAAVGKVEDAEILTIEEFTAGVPLIKR